MQQFILYYGKQTSVTLSLICFLVWYHGLILPAYAIPAHLHMASEGYIKQLSIHNEIFPVRAATSTFINSLLFGLIAYFLMLLVLAPGMLSLWTLLLFPALLLYYVFGVSMATIAASAQVYIRDYAPTQSLILQALFYITPILYDFNMMRDMGYSLIYTMNPFFLFDPDHERLPDGSARQPKILACCRLYLSGSFCRLADRIL